MSSPTAIAAAPAGAAVPGDLLPLRIREVRRMSFERVRREPDPAALRYFADLLTPYGRMLAEDRGAYGPRDGFTGMAERLVTAMAPKEPLDLVVLAHATPDADPWRCAAARITAVCAGEPLAFAVSDQGAGAPFTALRIARAHARATGARHALVAILDQGAVPYNEPAINGSRPVREQAVGVLLGDGRTGHRAAVRQVRADPEQVSAVLSAELRRAFASRAPLLIAGPGLVAVGGLPRAAGQVRCAPADLPATAVWAQLADELRGQDPAGIAAADYDLGRRFLWLLALPATEAPDPAAGHD